MTLQETMKTLESLGAAQNRKVYARHGAGPNMFGVSFASLYKLQKKIRTDHDLACRLWATGNYDARALAILIADPARMSEKDLDAWVADARQYTLVDILVRHLASKTPHVRKKMEAWTRSDDEYVGQAGWDLLGGMAMNAEGLPDSYFERYLKIIEKNIHKAKNRTRHAMNGALIAIGLRNPKLEKFALAAAGRIGKVEVDHGETNCKTLDAAAYIKKTGEYRKRKARR
jgi:3-methyladenine DNA glycosylase AlkD